ncbi:MAG: DUF4136 domain-containing protein [Methylococcaceae bacterium]|nr:DUF4136 domain-containing protein [Methylococcaceae bacterium]
MMRKIALIVKGLLLGVLLAGCAATELVSENNMQTAFVTVHHSILHISMPATYRWSDGFMQQSKVDMIENVPMQDLLKQGIEQEMQRKGYRQVMQTEQADINISFAAALTSALDDQQIQKQYGLVPGLMVNPLNPQRYEKGTLIFDVLNPQTNKLAWRTAGQALASLEDIPLAERKARIQVFVKKMLAFLPEKE